MKDLWCVAKFTLKEMVKRKSFLVSNIIILALIVIGFNVPNIINKVTNNDNQRWKGKYYSSRSG